MFTQFFFGEKTNGASPSFAAPLNVRTCSALLVGSGAVSATVSFQGSEDDTLWLELDSLNLSGTDSASDSTVITSTMPYVRAVISDIFGHGAAVTSFSEDISDAAVAEITSGVTRLTGFTGASNTGLGAGAGDSITSGTGALTLGLNAGTALTTAVNVTAAGRLALQSAIDADDCTALGSAALASNVHGIQNTAGGSNALLSMTAADSTGFGYNALTNATGANNTGLGSGAGQEVLTGTGNSLVGKGAGQDLGNCSNTAGFGLGNNQGIYFTVNEAGFLHIQVRYAGGTMKTADIALV